MYGRRVNIRSLKFWRAPMNLWMNLWSLLGDEGDGGDGEDEVKGIHAWREKEADIRHIII